MIYKVKLFTISMKKLLFKNCTICGTKVYGKKRKDRNSYHYSPRCSDCSRKVFDPAKRQNVRLAIQKTAAANQLPVGSKTLHKSADGLLYWRIKIAQPNVWEYEHRILLKAPKGFHVHHRDKNTLNNNLENLILLSPQEHSKEHGLNGKWSIKHDFCVICKTNKRKHLSHGECTACYQRVRYKPIVVAS